MTARRSPRLVPVPNDGPPEPGAAPDDRRERQTRRLIAALGVALALSLAGLVSQILHARSLESQLTALSTALQRAEGEIEARHRHLEAVRSEVAQFQADLQALAELVSREPAGEPAAAD